MANIKELIQSIEAADSSFDEKLAAINQMEETLVAMRQQEETAVQENVDLIVEAIKVMEDKVNAQLEIAKSIVPEKGEKGDKGLDGKQGKDGRDGKDGKDGINGKDGADGKDGVSVTDAKIDFDGSLIISLSTGQEINVGEVVAPELQEKIKLVTSGGAGTVLPSQTGNANKYLKTDGTALSWATVSSSSGTVTSVGTSGSVNGITLTGGPITSSGTVTLGGTLDLSSPPAIGGTTASTGRFTTVTSTVATGTAPFTVASTTPVTNLSIGGNAGTVTNGVYTTDTGTVTNTMLAGSIANAKLTNSSITFGSTAQALGSTVSGLSGVTIDNGAVGGTTPAAVTATTLIGGGGSANYGQITGGATGKAVQFQTLGSDGNVSLAIQPKGTGAIDLAAGSSGVNISNGGTVTAITGTALGSYTTVPTITISAPTTAGGTQATGTVAMQTLVATIQSGGSGYAIGDTITFTGGTFSTPATLTVATLSGSAIATFTSNNGGTYTVLPTNPISTTTSGAGTGATFNVTSWGVRTTAYTITNAGSGYVEQPTVSFSGGGGSGATAYATVGSTTTIKSLATTLSFYTPAGQQVQINDGGGDGGNYWRLQGAANTGGVQLLATGTGSTTPALYSTKSTAGHTFYTNTFAQAQFVVSHTASAVNYVQVTGGASGSPATVTISAQGSSTDVDMALTPRGAGVIKFGTYTGTILTPTGYITIKDSGGTSRRLLVG